jgi:hypothetical protein
MANLKTLAIVAALVLPGNSLVLAQSSSGAGYATSVPAHSYTARHHQRLHGSASHHKHRY